MDNIPQTIAPFEFLTAARIVFGTDSLLNIGDLVTELAGDDDETVFVVAGKHTLAAHGPAEQLRATLEVSRFDIVLYETTGEPTVSSLTHAVNAARERSTDIVIGLGGGSALDTAKAVAGLVRNAGEVTDYLEGVGRGYQVTRDVLPMIAVPTTAGTGTEVTKNAVITADDGSFKKSMRSNLLIPDIALIDPLLTVSVPPDITAYSGLDALTQLIESYTSNKSGPMTDGLALTGIHLAARSLKRAFVSGVNINARTDMSLAALLSGICLANAGLGAAHGIVAPLGAAHGVPHGAGCAVLLPQVVAVNARKLSEENHPTAEKYRTVAEIFGETSADPLPELMQDLVQTLNVPGLSSWGVTERDIPALVAKSRGSSMRYNPIELTDEEIAGIIRNSL